MSTGFHDVDRDESPPEKRRHVMRPFLLLGLYFIFLFLLLLFAGSGGRGGKGSGSGGQDSGDGAAGVVSAGEGPGGAQTGEERGTSAEAVTDPENTSPGAGGTAAVEPEAAGGTAIMPVTPESRAMVVDRITRGDNSGPPAAGSSEAPGTAGATGGSGFFGISVHAGHRVIFLLDISGSMSSQTKERQTRIAVLKRELQNTVKSLQKSAGSGTGKSGFYRITAFASDFVDFPENGSPVLFSDRARNAGFEAFLQKLSASGDTKMMGAWRHILDFIRNDRIDTIYFLSDGAPSDCGTEELLAMLKDNLPSDITVHCISIGRNSDLLQEIARRYCGMYTEHH